MSLLSRRSGLKAFATAALARRRRTPHQLRRLLGGDALELCALAIDKFEADQRRPRRARKVPLKEFKEFCAAINAVNRPLTPAKRRAAYKILGLPTPGRPRYPVARLAMEKKIRAILVAAGHAERANELAADVITAFDAAPEYKRGGVRPYGYSLDRRWPGS